MSSDADEIAFTGPDRSTLVYYDASDDYKLVARAPDGKVLRLPMTADTDSFAYSRGWVWFTPRGSSNAPGERSVARSDGTVAGTRYVAIESPSHRIDKVLSLDGQVMIDGYSFGQYISATSKRVFAFDTRLNRFRPVNFDAIVNETGSEYDAIPDSAGMVNGRRLFYVRETRSLYELTFPETGNPTFKHVIRLPRSEGDNFGAIGATFLGGKFYYTTGTRANTDSPRPTSTWRSDGTGAGTVKLSGGVVRLDDTYENAVTIGATHYVLDGTRLLSFNDASTSFTYVTTLENADLYHLTAAGDRLFYSVLGRLYTIKPQGGTTTRAVTGTGESVEDSGLPAVVLGNRYIIRVTDTATSRQSLLITQARSSTERRIILPPYPPDGQDARFDIQAVAGNGDVLVSASSNQGPGYYRIRVGSASNAPTAVIRSGLSMVEGGGLRLDASESADADGDSLSYAWDLDNDGQFDDHTTAEAVSAISWSTLRKLGHRDGPDTFRIRVRVSDLEHATVSSPAIVRLKDAPPAVNVTQPAQVRANTPTELKLAFADAGTDAVTRARVEWGDGTSDDIAVTAGAAIAAHTYAAVGKFTVSVFTTDEDGSRLGYSGTIDVVRQLSGPVLIGSVDNQFDLEYDSLVLRDGTLIYEKRRTGDAADLFTRTPDGAPVRVLIKDRFLWDWQIVGKRALLMVSKAENGSGGFEYYCTDGVGKRTRKIAELSFSDMPVVTSMGAYFHSEGNRLKFVDIGTLAVSTARTDKREYPTIQSDLIYWRNNAYFLGKSYKTGNVTSLWRVDGTTIVHIRSFPAVTSSAKLEVAGDRLMISGTNFSTTLSRSSDYLSDGTSGGTVAIKAADGDEDGTTYADASNFDLTRIYVVRNGSKNDFWSLDIASATARKFRSFERTNSDSFYSLGQAGKYIYFNADDGTRGEQIWRTDGTVKGTVALGFTTEFSDSFAVVGDYAYFTGKHVGDDNPRGFWVTDGSPAGTRRVTADGTDLSRADGLSASPSSVAFTVARGATLEIWKVKSGRDQASRVATINTTPLAGGRFSFAAAVQASDVWYVTAHVYAGSKNRDYLWAVYV